MNTFISKIDLPTFSDSRGLSNPSNFSWGVSNPGSVISPRDPGSGLPTGRR